MSRREGGFVRDFVAAWNKVMNLDRYHLLAEAGTAPACRRGQPLGGGARPPPRGGERASFGSGAVYSEYPAIMRLTAA